MSTVFTHYLLKITLALALLLLVTGCAAPPSALMLIPATGAATAELGVDVYEYPLVEQSIDSPTHAGFSERVPGAVTAIRGAWRFPGEDRIAGPNQVLERFGYRLVTNPSPPFSGYALFHGSQEVQRDIAHFWPISVKDDDGQAQDFLLAFETLNGERLVATASGIDLWPGQQPLETSAPPVYYRGRIAHAQTTNGVVSVMAGGDVLYAGQTADGETPYNLQTWGGDAGGQHWALELGRRVILNGVDFNQAAGYEEVFHWQIIDGQPFYFFNAGGLTYISYAGSVQPFIYDHVIHGNHGETSQFNPGSNDQMVWFYALRDGLWYYVEVQARQEVR